MTAADHDPSAPGDAGAATAGRDGTSPPVAAQPPVAAVELDELEAEPAAPGDGLPAAGLDLLADIEVDVTVELGRARMRVQDVLALRAGSVVELNRPIGAPVDLLANGRIIARGQIVVVEDQLGVRVTEFAPAGGGHG